MDTVCIVVVWLPRCTEDGVCMDEEKSCSSPKRRRANALFVLCRRPTRRVYSPTVGWWEPRCSHGSGTRFVTTGDGALALVAAYRFEMLAIEPAETVDLNQPDVIANEVEQRTEMLQHAVATVFQGGRTPLLVELAELQCELSLLRASLFVSRPEDQAAISAYHELRKLQQEAEQRRAREHAAREEGRQREAEQARQAWERAQCAAEEALARHVRSSQHRSVVRVRSL